MGSASTKLDLNQQNWTVVGELRGSDSSGLATVSLVIDESGAWPAASTSLGMSKIGSDTTWAKSRGRQGRTCLRRGSSWRGCLPQTLGLRRPRRNIQNSPGLFVVEVRGIEPRVEPRPALCRNSAER